MSSIFKISGPVRVGKLSADPSSPENGLIYYNTTSNEFRYYINGSFQKIADQSIIDALVASDIAYERADGSKKNIQAASDTVEPALSDLDDALGDIAALGTPSNYSTTSETEVAARLAGIDSALATAGGTEFGDDIFRVTDNADATKKMAFEVSALTTATTRTVTMPDANVDLTEVGDLRTLSGTSAGDTDLGTFTGTTIADSRNTKQALQDLETKIENVESTTNNFEWQASAKDYIVDNTAVPPTEVSGDRYVLSHDGGAPHANWDGASAGDIVEFNGTSWVAVTPTLGTFISVDDESNVLYYWGGAAWTTKSFESTTASTGLTKSGVDVQLADANTGGVNITSGAVTVNVDDSTIEKGVAAGNPLQVKDGGIGDAKLGTGINANKIADGSVSNTEFQYIGGLTSDAQTQLSAKLENVVEDTTPQLGGDLDVNGNAIEDASNDIVIAGADSVKRAKQASKSSFIEEEYIHSISMLGSQTDTVIADLTFAHATVEGCEIVYKVKEATSGDIMIGTLRVVTNGTSVVLSDVGTETADTGITFSAAINGANVEIRYSSGTNGATMRCDVKRFLA